MARKGGIVFSLLYICLVYISCVKGQFELEDLRVEAGDLGTIQGVPSTTVSTRRPFIQFLGIPYASPPVEGGRFLPPVPASTPLRPEGEIFYANKTTGCCPQSNAYILCAASQTEDCLGLTIYTPYAPRSSEKKLPVIVFIHGGGFTMGSDGVYTGTRLLEKDVILVKFNYRLGALGFFCLNTPSAPGNAAMYDIVEALNWVNKYISYFGGDPNLVTISGQSAGAAAVSHMLTSPMTRDAGLFHRAIAMSGTVLNEWGTTTSDKAERASLKIAEIVGCYTPSPTENPNLEEIVLCMQGADVKVMVAAIDKYQMDEHNAGRLGFEAVTPVIQRVGPVGKGRFLDESPEAILNRNEEASVPLITGSTRHDGSIVIGLVYNRFLRFNNLTEDEAFLKTQIVPTLLSSLGIEDKTEAVFDALANTYLGKEVRNSGNLTLMLPGLTDMFTVFYFKAAIFRTLKLHSRHQPQSYWYNFDYKGRHSMYSMLIDTTNNPVRGGVAHADDLIYLFPIPLKSLNATEQIFSDRMVNYWVNFAYSGNPNTDVIEGSNNIGSGHPTAGEWPAFSEALPNFAVIGEEDTFIADNPNDYWIGATEELYPELIEDEVTTTIATTITTTTDPETDPTTDPTTDDTTDNTTDGTTDDTEPTESGNTTATTEAGGDAPEVTTGGSESLYKQSSYLLLIIATFTLLLEAQR